MEEIQKGFRPLRKCDLAEYQMACTACTPYDIAHNSCFLLLGLFPEMPDIGGRLEC